MTNAPTVEAHPLMVRRYFSAQNEDFAFEGPFESEEEACRHWPPNETKYARIISILVPLGTEIEVDYWEVGTTVNETTLVQTWEFEEPTGE